jgi:hypothetical protein
MLQEVAFVLVEELAEELKTVAQPLRGIRKVVRSLKTVEQDWKD